MRYEIVLTQTAIETYESIFEQIRAGWGDKVADKFEIRMFETLNQICQTPLIFKSISENPSIRKGLMNKTARFSTRLILLKFRFFSSGTTDRILF